MACFINFHTFELFFFCGLFPLCALFFQRHTPHNTVITLRAKLIEESGMQAQESVLAEKNPDISKALGFKSLAPTFQVLK